MLSDLQLENKDTAVLKACLQLQRSRNWFVCFFFLFTCCVNLAMKDSLKILKRPSVSRSNLALSCGDVRYWNCVGWGVASIKFGAC